MWEHEHVAWCTRTSSSTLNHIPYVYCKSYRISPKLKGTVASMNPSSTTPTVHFVTTLHILQTEKLRLHPLQRDFHSLVPMADHPYNYMSKTKTPSPKIKNILQHKLQPFNWNSAGLSSAFGRMKAHIPIWTSGSENIPATAGHQIITLNIGLHSIKMLSQYSRIRDSKFLNTAMWAH